MRNKIILLSIVALFIITFHSSYAFLPLEKGSIFFPVFGKIKTSNGTMTSNSLQGTFELSCSGCTVTESQALQKIFFTVSPSSTFKGTYNTTLANNIVKNSGGAKLNFINGTSNPVNIVNDPTRNQVNITISSTGVGGGITSINSQTGPAMTITRGANGNITIMNNTNNLVVNTGWNIPLLNGIETFVNAVTFNSLKLGGDADIGSNALTNSGHKSTLPLNSGTLLQQNGSASSLSNNVRQVTAGTGISTNGTTGTVAVTNTGVTSISGTSGNITTSASTGSVTLNLGSNVVTTGGSAQTINGIKTLSGNDIFSGNNQFTGNNNFGNGKVLIENPAKTFDTAIGNGVQYQNNTVGFPVILGTADTFGLLNATQSWLQINSYLNAGIRMFNPAATQFYSIQSSAITANRILTLPLTTQSETFAVKPQINFTSPANQTGTASVSGVMLGDGVTLTPTVTGRVEISVSGYVTSSVAADGCVLELRQGTGGSPANGAALTGTIRGSNMKITDAATTSRAPFSDNYMVSGLTVGTKVWAELGQKALTGGTCTVFNVNWTIKEL